MGNGWEKVKKFFHKYKTFIKYLIFIVICYLLITIELPFVVYKPGGIVNLNNRINIKNDNIEGSLSMSYVSLMRGTIPVVGLSYLLPNWDLFPRSEVTIDNGSIDELMALEKVYMASSINNATFVAYQKAGKPITVKSQTNHIVYITDEAQTNLALSDEIIAVEKQKITTLADISTILKDYQAGDKVEVLIKRNNKEMNAWAILYELDGTIKMGISILPTYEYETDPDIKITTKSSESGSSGGLMMALAIYNKLTPEDITKGKKIVGTGTIDQNGEVGEIDGVKYKILGAVKNKADVFLCPAANYDEALKVKKDNKLKITIKAVATFDEALNYLTTLEKEA